MSVTEVGHVKGVETQLVTVNTQNVQLKPVQVDNVLWLWGNLIISNSTLTTLQYKVQGMVDHYICQPNSGTLQPNETICIRLEIQGPYVIRAHETRQNFEHRFIFSAVKIGEKKISDVDAFSDGNVVQRFKFCTSMSAQAMPWLEDQTVWFVHVNNKTLASIAVALFASLLLLKSYLNNVLTS